MAKRNTKRRNTKHRNIKSINTKLINTKHRNTKRRNIKSKDNKRKGIKHKNRKNKTKKKEVYEKAGMQCLNKCLSSPPRHDVASLDVSVDSEPEPELDALMEPEPEPEPEPVEYESSTPNILNKFFERLGPYLPEEWPGINPDFLAALNAPPPSYILNIPNDEIFQISCHGRLLPDDFIIVPDNLTLYFPVSAGQPNSRGEPDFFGDASRDRAKLLSENLYLREYPPGSIIQNELLSFNPFYNPVWTTDMPQKLGRYFNGEEHWYYYAERGVLRYKIETQAFKPKNSSEKIAEIIRIINYNLKNLEEDKISDIKYIRDEAGGVWRPELQKLQKIHLRKNASTYFKNNIEKIISESVLIDLVVNNEGISLSDILHKISEARKADSSISGDWFCTFCRSGEPIDIEQFKKCNTKGLPRLSKDFFDADIHHEGVSQELTKQSSLASKAETRNFRNTFNELYSKKDSFTEKEVSKLETINKTINRLPPEPTSRWFKCCESKETYSLSYNDVCFVFQMKQKYRSIL